MPVGETILVVAALAFATWLYWHVVRSARDGTLSLPEEGEPSPEWWPFSDGMWRGAGRAILITMPCIMVFIVVGWSYNRFEPATGPSDLLLGLLSLVGFVWLGLTATITLFNRPRFLVPQEMRSQLGVIQERRQRRRARKQARRAR